VKGEVKYINGKRVSTPEYRSWQMMKNRCTNPRAQDWAYYGGRGIVMDPRWGVFDAFLEDMGRQPSKGLTLDRRDPDGHYCKDNCRWATRRVQSQNRTDSRFNTQKVQLIRDMYATGLYRQIDLAHVFETSQAAISQITRNAAWLEDVGGAP
jgi:hypothetical protein